MPAAAVIPAPIAYIKIVAVKTLVVGYLLRGSGPSKWRIRGTLLGIYSGKVFALCCVSHDLNFYFEEMRVFQAGFRREYDSME